MYTFPFRTHLRSGSRQAFTLIELLMVIGVIGILAAISFGITRGVKNAQNSAKVKVELAAISQALEQFKATHGDYPWIQDDPVKLTEALLGWMEFEGSGNELKFVDKEQANVPANGPKPFIDISKLTYSGELPATPSNKPDNLLLTDPWNQPYVYYYKDSLESSWDNFGYILYSVGADGDHVPVGDDGILTDTIRDSSVNVDNFYAGE